MLSVALQGLRGRKAPFVGAFVALAVAAALVMACGTLLQAGLTSKPPVERYAGAPLVVSGAQSTRINVGTNSEDSVPLYERVRVPSSLGPRLATVPGVGRAIADVSVPAQLEGSHGAIAGPGGHPVLLHPWSTAALTPYTLQRGRVPARPGEVVIDSGVAARGRVQVGSTLKLAANGPAQAVRIVGIAHTPVAIRRQGAVFATSKAVQQLAGVGDQADAIGILPERGVDAHALATRLNKLVGNRAHVVTGSARGDVEHVENIEARDAVTAVGGTFGGLALFIAMFVVASTIGLSVLQREREVALLRAIAATPKQVRRMIRWETILIALVASAVGVIPGAAIARELAHAMSERGLAPEDMHVAIGVVPVMAAIASSVLTALLAVAAAGRRAGRVRPTVALQESGGAARLIGPLRVVAGLVSLAGAVALLGAAAASGDPASAADLAVGVSFALVLATTFLGPLIVRMFASVATLMLGRRAGSVGAFLAVSNMRSSAARFSSAITPLVLTVAISSTLLFTGTTRDHAAAEQERARVIADLVLQSDAGAIPAGALSDARNVDGVTTAVGVADTTVLGLGSTYVPVQAAAVDPAGLPEVLDLSVSSGSLRDLRDGSVAISKTRAAMSGVSVGDHVHLTLGDGAQRDPRVVAIYRRGLGFGDVVLPASSVTGHVTNPGLTSVLIGVAHGQRAATVAARMKARLQAYPGVTVGDRAAHGARADKNREGDDWLFRILAAVVFAFTAIAVVNTLMMIALHRRRELALLQLVGGTRRQIIAMARWEGAITVALGLGLGTLIALSTLVPTSTILSGSHVPTAPIGLVALVLGSAAAIGLLATQVSTRIALRPRPVDGMSIGD
jgi:putative ABC transport system permease protein